MKILLSTPVFKPMVGGMETMADNLARHFTARGHEVTLVTPIAATEADDAPYPIVRQPGWKTFYRLTRESDLVFSNGASLYAAPWIMLTGKPTVMRHTGYQVSCIDGAGWCAGQPAPLSHWASFGWYLKKGFWKTALRGIPKTLLLRFFARHFVSANVAISDWMLNKHPLPNQLRIHNPFPIHKFVAARNTNGNYDFDFFFLGRLITEKGVDVLIKAFSQLQERQDDNYRLCIIGGGPEQKNLENLASSLGQQDAIFFAGMQTGEDLLNLVRRSRIAVLPSTWEEPFGGVASELMAAGKVVITSRNGALSEIVGDAGLIFENGNAPDLSTQMEYLITSPILQEEKGQLAKKRLEVFDEDKLINEYIQLFQRLIQRTTLPQKQIPNPQKTKI